MSDNLRNEPVSMIRHHLDNIPEYPLPPGYRVRWYRPGDEHLWLGIHQEAERYVTITPELYVKEFGADETVLHERQFFLLDSDGNAFGTTTAWFNDSYRGRPYGRIHWVAITPKMQGRGLARPMLTVACLRLRELGHQRAYLETSAARIPAINLYRKFGFEPEINTPEDAAIWREIEAQLSNR